jgi:hypothetical protein
MSHFAKVNQNNEVVAVIVADQEFVDNYDDRDGGAHRWVQCSYNTRGGVYYTPNTNEPDPDQSKALRKNYPRVGCVYDEDRDAFYFRQPYKSWDLDEDTCEWNPPVPRPKDYWNYQWNENNLEWEPISNIIIDNS